MATNIDLHKCDICNQQHEELLHCLECTLDLCGTCSKNIHTKIPSTLTHHVNKHNPETDEDTRTLNDLDINCSKHKENKCLVVCTHCTRCLCTTCLEKPDEKIFSEKLVKLKSSIEEDLPFFTEELETFEQLKEKYEGKYNEIKDEILDKKHKMKETINEHAETLIKELDEWWAPTKEMIDQEEIRLTHARDDLEKQKTIIEDALTSNNSAKVIQAAGLVYRDDPINKLKLDIEEPKKIRLKTSKPEPSLELGSLELVPDLVISEVCYCQATSILVPLDREVIMGYNDRDQTICHFVLTTDHQCYYTKRMGKKQNYDHKMSSITTHPNKAKLYTILHDNKYPQIISETSEEKYQCDQAFTMSQYEAKAIHNDGKGRIYVGYINTNKSNEKVYTPTNNSRRGICVFNTKHQLLDNFQLNKTYIKPLTLPTDITTSVNGDICVLDKINEKEGRVIVLDKRGDFRWEYDGKTEEDQEAFLPRHITVSPSGYIFVSDMEGNKVIMLSQDGVVLNVLGEAEGLDRPSGLAIYKENQLLIGCEWKLHIVNINA